ncbi:MAG TPA: hypothetical protein VK923_13210 [Euzebyales bacterium]|nr:hypothetical protein [Euzebyales bacterium]
MDLGRPVARHDIRRPHEMSELEEILVESAADEQPADEQPVGSETSEH